MPKRTKLEISEKPFSYKGKLLCMNKSYTDSNFRSHTILTDDVFTYIEFYFSSHTKALKYRNPSSKSKYGNEKNIIIHSIGNKQ